jgi:hypothetical protein
MYVCMYVNVFILMYVCLYIYIYMYVYIYIYINGWMCALAGVPFSSGMCVRVCVHIYIYIYIYIHTYIYIYIRVDVCVWSSLLIRSIFNSRIHTRNFNNTGACTPNPYTHTMMRSHPCASPSSRRFAAAELSEVFIEAVCFVRLSAAF